MHYLPQGDWYTIWQRELGIRAYEKELRECDVWHDWSLSKVAHDYAFTDFDRKVVMTPWGTGAPGYRRYNCVPWSAFQRGLFLNQGYPETTPFIWGSVDPDDFSPNYDVGEEGYFLYLSRIHPSKRPELVTGMAKKTGIPLVVAGDSVAGHSPVIVGYPGSRYLDRVKVTSVEALWNSTEGEVMKTTEGEEVKYLSVYGKEVHLYNGGHMAPKWTPINHILRHRYTGNILSITCRGGKVDVTPNHSLISAHGNIFDARNIRLGGRLSIATLKEIKGDGHNLFIGSKDVAWLMGFFLAEGNMNNSHSEGRNSRKIFISNQNKDFIEKSVQLLVDEFHVKSHISYDKGYGTQRSELWRAIGYGKGLYQFFLSNFYDGKLKRVPDCVINAPRDVQVSFLEGYIQGDGEKDPDGAVARFDTNSQVAACGLTLLYANLGYPSFSLRSREDKPTITSIAINSANGNRLKDKLEVTKVIEVPYSGYVYDIALQDEPHTFATGIGPVRVHNTESPDHVHYLQQLREDVAGYDNIRIHVDPTFRQKVELYRNARALVLPSLMECVLPGSFIVTHRGLVPIEDIVINDRVMTHKGRFRDCRLVQHPFFGNVVRLSVAGFGLPLEATGDHLIYAIKSVGWPYPRAWKVTEPSWIPINELMPGDMVCIPPLQVKNRIPEARLMGYYVSEGSVSESNVNLSFGPKDGYNIEDVRRHFRTSVHERGNVTVVTLLGSAEWARSFPQLFGPDATQKRVPEFLLAGDLRTTAELLRGMFRGDGCRTHRNGFPIWTYSTSSRLLAIQMVQMLAKLKIRSALSMFNQSMKAFSKGNVAYHVNVSCDVERMDRLMHSAKEDDRDRRGRWAMANLSPWGTLYPVSKKEVFPYSGPVYNLHVEEDESYLVDGFSVHNCFGLVVIEAMAAGTPAILADDGAFPEIIEDGTTGFLCRTPADYEHAVRNVDTLDRRACREAVERTFNCERMAKEYIDIYKRVADGETF